MMATPGGARKAVAVKKIYVADQMDLVAAFLTEIKIASTLRHRNIMQVIGVSHVGETDLCLVTELAERGSLRHVLDKKGEHLPMAMRFYLARGAARGLIFLHSRRVIHRYESSGEVQCAKETTFRTLKLFAPHSLPTEM